MEYNKLMRHEENYHLVPYGNVALVFRCRNNEVYHSPVALTPAEIQVCGIPDCTECGDAMFLSAVFVKE